jgi:hypothetical protein
MDTCLTWLLSDQLQAIQLLHDHQMAQLRLQTDLQIEALRHELSMLTLTIGSNALAQSASRLSLGVDPHLGTQ